MKLLMISPIEGKEVHYINPMHVISITEHYKGDPDDCDKIHHDICDHNKVDRLTIKMTDGSILEDVESYSEIDFENLPL